jgi:FdhD protein
MVRRARGRYNVALADVFRHVDVTRIRIGTRSRDVDRAVTEEPLEVRLHDRPFAVIMRTPGADRDLAAGFLLGEGVLKSADDFGIIEDSTDSRADHPVDIVNVTLTNQSGEPFDRLFSQRRNVTMYSSCGLCGRLTIDSLRTEAPPLSAKWTIASSTLVDLPDRLRQRQAVFDSTGGLHAAGLFTRDGQLVTIAEDVGIHNAVTKVVGRMLIQERLPLSDYLLFVSGRASYEIVQKALLAGTPIVAAVSAPSSLAVTLAEDCRMTLIGFLRGTNFNIYSHAERVVS